MPQRWRVRADRFFQRGEVVVVHGAAAGLRLPARAVAPSHAHSRLLLTGDLDVAVQEALRRTVAPGDCVYDVGANVGFFSAFAARLVGRGGHVLAFEPVADVATLARETAQRNDLAEVIEVRALAVGAQERSVRMHVVGRGSIWSHIADRHPHLETVATIEVQQTTLDAVIAAGARPPDVVKLDVEGSEVAVLRGATRLLATRRPAIVCELHGTNAEVAALLEDAGYELEPLDGTVAVRDAGPGHVLARPVR